MRTLENSKFGKADLEINNPQIGTLKVGNSEIESLDGQRTFVLFVFEVQLVVLKLWNLKFESLKHEHVKLTR